MAAGPVRAIMIIGPHTGSRVFREALTLKWENINLPGRMLAVQAAFGKTHERCEVPLNPVALETLTAAVNGTTQTGYAMVVINSGVAPYGTAVFSFRRNGVTVGEAGVPASPPTTAARIFIDHRSAVAAIPGASALVLSISIPASP